MAYRNSSGSRRGGSGVADELATGLAWFSLALGALQLMAPRTLARGLGMHGSERLIQAYGMREIATGVGILGSTRQAPWLWGRVAGDALDIGTLTMALDSDNPKRGNVGIAIAAVAGVTALDVYTAQALASEEADQRRLPPPDYSDRIGFSRPPQAMRGAASDFEAPRDFRIPEPLRPYRTESSHA